MKTGSLPLGIDFGATRLRVAAFERRRDGSAGVTGVATREVPQSALSPEVLEDIDVIAAILEDGWRELGTRERRCTVSLPAQTAVLRVLKFPRMNETERRRAARFEAERFSPWDAKEVATLVRTHWVNRRENLIAVGVARAAALQTRTACVKRAGLRTVAVDHDACAVQRAFPFADAAVDIGYRGATVHAFCTSGPVSHRIAGGGFDVTRAIGAELGIDDAAAERRKRILGTAGAGESARDRLAANVADAMARVRERFSIRRIALTGNGSRLAGLAEAIEMLTGAMVDVPVSDLLRGGRYPDDVARSAAPDWTLAASLATWGCR